MKVHIHIRTTDFDAGGRSGGNGDEEPDDPFHDLRTEKGRHSNLVFQHDHLYNIYEDAGHHGLANKHFSAATAHQAAVERGGVFRKKAHDASAKAWEASRQFHSDRGEHDLATKSGDVASMFRKLAGHDAQPLQAHHNDFVGRAREAVQDHFD